MATATVFLHRSLVPPLTTLHAVTGAKGRGLSVLKLTLDRDSKESPREADAVRSDSPRDINGTLSITAGASAVAEPPGTKQGALLVSQGVALAVCV